MNLEVGRIVAAALAVIIAPDRNEITAVPSREAAEVTVIVDQVAGTQSQCPGTRCHVAEPGVVVSLAPAIEKIGLRINVGLAHFPITDKKCINTGIV